MEGGISNLRLERLRGGSQVTATPGRQFGGGPALRAPDVLSALRQRCGRRRAEASVPEPARWAPVAGGAA